MSTETLTPYLEPVRHSVIVNKSPQEAFELFTRRITDWWPKDRFSVSQERTAEVVLEPFRGGAVYEIRDDGERFPWAEVLLWEEHQRLVLAWHPGRERHYAQEVEVRFERHDEGTCVELEHRNWQQLGDAASEIRDNYVGGWRTVLGAHFADFYNE